MTNLIQKFEKEQLVRLTENKIIPEFRAGDTVRVSVSISDGKNDRIQEYEGVVIAKRNRGINSSFLVRKISYGEGIERRFFTYSTVVKKINVVKYGIVRRAKLFYLRHLSGKAARIPERRMTSQSSKAKTTKA